MLSFSYLGVAFGLTAIHCLAQVTAPPGLLPALGGTEPSPDNMIPTSGNVSEWLFYPKNGSDQDAVNNTEQNIGKILQAKEVFSFRDINNTLVLWSGVVNDTQLKLIQEDDGVSASEQNVVADQLQALIAAPSPTGQLYDEQPDKVRRNLAWATQSTPVTELRFISQPTTVSKISDLANYVYENHGGRGRYIYHVELGAAVTANPNEFPAAQVEFLQMADSAAYGQSKDTDDSNIVGAPGHGTCSASKAAGQLYGAAKGATLVIVKMKDLTARSTATVNQFIWKDIYDKGRQGQSVVLLALTSELTVDPNNIQNPYRRIQRDAIKFMLDRDVIVVTASGNQATNSGRSNIDTAPAVFAAPDYPIIVIGASDMDGNRAVFSQGGNLLTILAPGQQITCQGVSGPDPVVKSGTSFAAALVAGVMATFLAYDTALFDMTAGKVAANAKQYLIDTANWERTAGNKAIWNGVTEAENPKNPPPLAIPSTTTTSNPNLPTIAGPDK